MELIGKAALRENIEKRYNECLKRAKIIDDEYWNGKADAYLDTLIVLDNIEVKDEAKDVDLEKEIELVKGDYEQVNVAWNNDFDYIAKHFFELGLKASNPLTWKDISCIEDITNTILTECNDKILYDTEESFCKEILKRFKAQN